MRIFFGSCNLFLHLVTFSVCLHLLFVGLLMQCELAGREGVPVSQGLLTSLRVLLQFFPDHYPEKVVHSLTSTSCIMLPVSCKFSSNCAIQAYISVAEQEGDLADLIGKSPSLVSNFMLFRIFQYGNFAAAGYRPQGFLFC